MPDLLVALVCHNELTRRGEGVLRRCLDSLTRAMGVAAHQRRSLDVYVACCDDASTDDTPDFIDRYFAGKSWFRLVRNQMNRYIGFCRNVAAGQFATELICCLDADDAYQENHLVVCNDMMAQGRDPSGRRLLAAHTTASIEGTVHPEWARAISRTINLTKVVRRLAWDFVEGMPMESVYRVTTCEDQFFAQKLETFVVMARSPETTVSFYAYPGSSLYVQRHKFARAQALYDPVRDEPATVAPFTRQRLEHEAAILRYLLSKWHLEGWEEKLHGFAIRSIPRLAAVHGTNT